MVHCVLEFMGQAETLPDQRFGAVQHDQRAEARPRIRDFPALPSPATMRH